MNEQELIEGPEAFKRFDTTIKRLLSVPRAELIRREAEYKKQSEANPNKRGPKRKAAKPSAFPDPAS